MNGNDVVSSFITHIAWEKLPPAVQRKTRMALLDTLGATLIATLTPVSRIAADLLTIGERILNVERLFNLRHGATRADEACPIASPRSRSPMASVGQDGGHPADGAGLLRRHGLGC